MAIQRSEAVADGLLTELSDQLDLAFIYIFSGPVPATPDEALDMGSDHTLLVVIGNGGDSTGITWGSPSGGILPKNSGEDWEGTADFTGANSGTSPQAPTFFRICSAGDNGQGAGSGSTYRIQGTVGGPGSGADLILPASTIADEAAVSIGDGSLSLLPF